MQDELLALIRLDLLRQQSLDDLLALEVAL